jgi:hypothetical protein
VVKLLPLKELSKSISTQAFIRPYCRPTTYHPYT